MEHTVPEEIFGAEMLGRLSGARLAEIWQRETGEHWPLDTEGTANALQSWAWLITLFKDEEEKIKTNTKAELVRELQDYISALELAQVLLMPKHRAGPKRPAEWLPVADWVDRLTPPNDTEHDVVYSLLARRLLAAKELLAAVELQEWSRGRLPEYARDKIIFWIVGDLRKLGATAANARIMCAEIMSCYGLPVPSEERDIRRAEQRHAKRSKADPQEGFLLCGAARAARSVQKAGGAAVFTAQAEQSLAEVHAVGEKALQLFVDAAYYPPP